MSITTIYHSLRRTLCRNGAKYCDLEAVPVASLGDVTVLQSF